MRAHGLGCRLDSRPIWSETVLSLQNICMGGAFRIVVYVIQEAASFLEGRRTMVDTSLFAAAMRLWSREGDSRGL